jgi:hypothetical protein
MGDLVQGPDGVLYSRKAVAESGLDIQLPSEPPPLTPGPWEVRVRAVRAVMEELRVMLIVIFVATGFVVYGIMFGCFQDAR